MSITLPFLIQEKVNFYVWSTNYSKVIKEYKRRFGVFRYYKGILMHESKIDEEWGRGNGMTWLGIRKDKQYKEYFYVTRLEAEDRLNHSGYISNFTKEIQRGFDLSNWPRIKVKDEIIIINNDETISSILLSDIINPHQLS